MLRFAPFMVVMVLEIFFPLVGSAVWLLAGRPKATVTGGRSPYERTAPAFPEYDRPNRERAEEQRQRAAEREQSECEDGSAT